MLEEFLAWWRAQWRDMLPRRWREAGLDRTPVLVIEPDRLDRPANLRVRLRQGGVERAIGELAAEPGAPRALASLLGGRARPPNLHLHLPAGIMLARDVTLPLAAERDVARVLQYEMDRLTPFAAAEIIHAHEVVRRDRVNGRLNLRLSLVHRPRVEPAIETLVRIGLAPDAIEGREAGGAVRRVPLASRRRGLVRADLLRRGGWAVAAGLALLACVTPFARQGAALGTADRTIARLRPRVAEAHTLRARIIASTAGADVLATARREVADPLVTLAALTRMLPDDTFLTDLSVTGRKLTLNGQSASAAKLIGTLAADPSIRNPAFVAPVTRLETSRSDLFSIRAELAP